MVWNLLPFKSDFTFGKSQKSQGTNLSCRGAESPGRFDVLSENSARDVMDELTHCPDEAANHQLPVAEAFWITGIVYHLSIFHRGKFKLNTQSDPDLLLYLLSHFECDHHTVHMLTNGIYCPHWLSAVMSSLFTHAHSSPLSLASGSQWCRTNHSRYINNGWTFSTQTLYVPIDTILSWTHFLFLATLRSKSREVFQFTYWKPL